MDPELIRAALKPDQERLRALLLAGENPDQQDELGETALNWASALGYTSVAKDLLAAGASVNVRGHRLRATPLMLAAAGAHRGIVALLVVHADVNGRDENGATPLLLALSKGGEQEVASRRVRAIVENLLQSGADPNLPDSGGDTPLMAAVRRGETGLVERLLEAGAEPQARDAQGETARSQAQRLGHSGIAALLDQH